MKRAADEPDFDAKREKSNPFPADSTALFKDPAQERHATDLLNWTTGESGFISGKVQMKWPLVGGKYRIVLETFSLSVGAKQFEVVFAGRCADKLASEGILFQVAQKLHISLRGADCTIKKQANSTAGSKLPIVLRYDEGVALETSSDGQSRKIDTWFAEAGPEDAQDEPEPAVAQDEPEPEVAQDDWFSTPRETAPPAFVLPESNLMDIDEESVSAPAVRTSKECSPPIQPIVAAKSSVSAPSASRKRHGLEPSGPSSKDFERRVPFSSTTMPPPPPLAPASSSLSHPQSVMVPAIVNTASISAPQVNGTMPPPPAPASGFQRPAVQKGNSVLPPAPIISAPVTVAGRPPQLPAPTSISAQKGHPQHAQDPVPSPLRSGTVLPKVVESSPKTEVVETSTLTRKQRKILKRKEKKNQRKASTALAVAESSEPTSASCEDPGPAPVVPPESISVPVPLIAPAFVAESKVFQSVSAPPAIDSSHLLSPPPEKLAKKAHPIPKDCCSIVDFKKKPRGSPNHVIGVVTYLDLKKPKDWQCVLHIVDRTSHPDHLLVSCFNPNQKELPVAEPGDVIILIGIKPSLWNNGVNAIGYHDRLRWAVYRDHSVVDMSDANSFSIYEPEVEELPYCADLEDWWRDMQQSKAEANGSVSVHQIEASRPVAPRREHKLISQVPTNTFFDCTVEVYSGHPCDNLHSIYVTDYTSIHGAKVFQKGWCPPALSEQILRIEMFDAAGLKGPNMHPGEYYSLKNVRMKRYDGHPQGHMSEAKIEKLDIAEIEENPHLKALLERKKAYGDLDADSEKLKLIAQGKDKEYLTCVVELLHADPLAGTIYITDYTQHHKMAPIQKPWARGLDGYVLKVMIEKEHSNELPSLEAGRYYRLKLLRLEESITAREFRGRLGGSGRIDLVNPVSSVLEEWKEGLIQRKTDLKRLAEPQPQITVAESPQADIIIEEESSSTTMAESQLETCVPPSDDGRTFSSINQVRSASDCPSNFVVRARVIDFFPVHLSQSFRRFCRKCDQPISDKHLSCVRCNDVEHNYVRFVSVFRILIHDGRDQLVVSISGDDPLLEGFEAAELDEAGTRRFSERMKPLIGHLLDANGLSRTMEEPTKPSSPMTFMVDSWRIGGSMAYGLRGYEL